MALRDRLRRLERATEGPVVSIPQPDGTLPKRFPEHQLAEAFTDGVARLTGRRGLAGDPEPGEHPLCAAARNSPDPAWRESFLFSDRPEAPIPDLSE